MENIENMSELLPSFELSENNKINKNCSQFLCDLIIKEENEYWRDYPVTFKENKNEEK